MADVGDRIAVSSKDAPRSGIVTAISGVMITVRWDAGGETSIVPGPGVLSVVTSQRSDQSARHGPTTSGAMKTRSTNSDKTRSAAARKAASGKKAAASKKAGGRKTRS